MQNDFVKEKNHIKINIHDNNCLIMQIVHYEIKIHMDTKQKNNLIFQLTIILFFTFVSAFC